MTPVRNNVVIEILPVEKTGNLLTAQTVQGMPIKGTAVAVGPGTPEFPMEIKAGATVIFPEHAGVTVSWEGKDLRVMRDTDVLWWD